MENLLNSIVGRLGTLEGLMVLRSVWDVVVDIGQLNHFANKYFSKVYRSVHTCLSCLRHFDCWPDDICRLCRFNNDCIRFKHVADWILHLLSVCSVHLCYCTQCIYYSKRQVDTDSQHNLQLGVRNLEVQDTYRTIQMQSLEADKSTTTYLKTIISSAVESLTSSTDLG